MQSPMLAIFQPARISLIRTIVARVQAAQHHLRFANAHVGQSLSPGAKILDFGCGIGFSVGALLAQGYDGVGMGAFAIVGAFMLYRIWFWDR